ncbi:MAG: S8 family serine peptidase [Flavobacteriaceae bacterium]|jgi:serine protease AprX|nr:S8 family serine peptidase [Flavobacteriaceae bacterium]MDG2498539.1 S8 family serine peptidase [Flavobacteriaceae bacterium]
MKKYLLTIVILGAGLNFGYGQTKSQSETIISASLKEKNEALIEKINESNNEKKSRIDAYLSQNPGKQRDYYIGENKYTIVDVINGTPIAITTNNAVAAIATRANVFHNGGDGGVDIEGQGMTAGVWDEENVFVDHVEFAGHFPNTSTIRVTTPDYDINQIYDNHATHVAGTIAAKGVWSEAKGMAPKSTIVSYTWDNDNLEVLDEVSTNGLLISNHSYGVPAVDADGEEYLPEWYLGCYMEDSRLWDEIHFNNPYYLQVVSAGNDGNSTNSNASTDGYDKLTREKNSKNNLVVANAQDPTIDANYQLAALSINSSSSQGPSDDNRIKPDITGNGTGLISPYSNATDSYASSTGTSMAAPNVAGSVLLLQQFYSDLNNGEFMKSATLKGLVCHTADDDFVKIGPDPVYGWGLLNCLAAGILITDNYNNEAKIIEGTLVSGGTYTTTFNAGDSLPVSATLCWTDLAGFSQSGNTNSTIPALVNNLDIKITAADGTIYYPWRLNPASPTGNALRDDVNNVDTVENIDIDSPSAGTYTLTVSHQGLLAGNSQDFSLIISSSDFVLSTNSNTENILNIWPNPAKELLNFKFASTSNASCLVQLVDLQGRTVYTENILGGTALIKGQLNTSNYAKGVYFLTLKQGSKNTFKKVIIQ